MGDDPAWTRILSKKNSSEISKNSDLDQAKVNLLTEFLIKQNDALNQRNQELLNQLAEADREIDRLKAEIFTQPNVQQPELESVVECLELELARSCGTLQKAKTQRAEIGDNLKNTSQTPQLKEATLRGLGYSENKMAFPEIFDRLHQCVQALEFKVSDLVNRQWLLTLTCKDPQTQHPLLVKSEVERGQKVIKNGIPLCEESACAKDQQHQIVEEELKKRATVFSLLLKVISQLAGNKMPDLASEHELVQINPKVLKRLQLENDIWESFAKTLKNTASNNMENEQAAFLLQTAEMKLEEVKMYLSVLNFNPPTLSSNSGPSHLDNKSLTNPDLAFINTANMEEEQRDVMWEGLKEHMEQRLILTDHITSKLISFTSNEHFFEVNQSYIWNKSNKLHPMISAVMDIIATYLTEKLSSSVKMQKSVAIQTENWAMMLEHNMPVDEKPEVNKDTGEETITSLKSYIEELEHMLSETLTSLQQQHNKDKENLKVDIMVILSFSFITLKYVS